MKCHIRYVLIPVKNFRLTTCKLFFEKSKLCLVTKLYICLGIVLYSIHDTFYLVVYFYEDEKISVLIDFGEFLQQNLQKV
jgi:hypothetical protein